MSTTEEVRERPAQDARDDTDLGDLLQEVRVLLQGAQVLTAFLVILPFNQGFVQITEIEKWVYLITFMCSVTSLVLFSAPAAMHRIVRPLRNPQKFKDLASRMVVVGLVFASLALTLAVQLVVSRVLENWASLIASGAIAVVILVLWWVLPLARKRDM